MPNIKTTAIIITIISLGSKLIGFAREIVLAYFYGTSYVVDAYLMAIAIPGIVFGWIVSLSVSYTPIYTEVRVKSGEDNAKRFNNNIISIAITIAIICAFIGVLFNNQIVSLAAPGFEGEVYNLTNRFLKVTVFSISINVFVQILISYLNCHNKFIASNISTLIISSTQLLVIYISSKLGKEILIYGTILSYIAQLSLLLFFSYKNGYVYKYELKITPEIKQAFSILVPIFISSMTIQINSFVNKAFASNLAEGSISALNYSGVIRYFIFYIFTVALTTMIYPMLSSSMAKNDINTIKRLVSKAITIIIILFIPISVGAIILSEPAIFFVYQRGEFSSQSTLMTSAALQMYSIGLAAVALRDVITKVFYSMKETKAIMYISFLTVFACIIFSTILIKPLEHAGLALAASLSDIITLPLFFYFLRIRLGNLGLKDSLTILIKSCISSVVMGLLVYFTFNYLNSSFEPGKIITLLSIAASAAAGASIYFVLMLLMKVEEMNYFTDLVKYFNKKVFNLINKRGQ